MVNPNEPGYEEVTHRPPASEEVDPSQPHVVEDDTVPQSQQPDTQADDEDAQPRKRPNYRRRYQREIDELRSQVEQLSTVAAQHNVGAQRQSLAQFDHEYQAAANSLVQARNPDADPRAFIAAQERFNRAHYQREMAYSNFNQQQQQPKQQQQSKTSKAANRWIEDNDWFDDPEYKSETRRARQIDDELKEEWDVDYDGPIGGRSYMRELDLRCKQDNGLKKIMGGTVASSAPRRGQVVVGGSTPASNRQTAELSQDLMKNAREAGLLKGIPELDKPILEKLKAAVKVRREKFK